MLVSLDHVAVLVRDLAAATHDYVRLLGRSPSWRGVHPGQGTANTLFRLDNTYLELISPVGEGAVAELLGARLGATGEGLCLLAFASDDLDTTVAGLRAGGLELPEPAKGLAQDSLSGAFRQFRNLLVPPAATGGVPILLIEHLSPPELLPPAQPVGDPRAAVAGLDHVVVFTEDPERAIAFYRDRLGLRLALDRHFEKRGLRLLFFRIGGATVEVGTRIAPQGDAPSAPPEADRLWGLAWRVPDAEAARARIAASGLELDAGAVREGHKPGTRVFSARGEIHGVPTLWIEPAPR
jgi:catechol 2,3-dioxygenase-like lactoylglutathione lyase family enzyme